MKRSRTHHFIPKGLQKYFCFEGKRIWYSEKGPLGDYGEPEIRNIDSTFQRKDYYTVQENGKPSDIIERNFYSKVDDFLAKVLKTVNASFSQGIVPVFDPEMEKLISRTLFYCVKRNPDFSSRLDDKSIGLSITEKMIEVVSAWDNAEILVERLKKRKETPIDLVTIGRDVRVRAQLKSSDALESELDTLSVRWIISQGAHSFILCSSLVYRLGNGGPNGLSNPNFEMWLPVSPKRALVLMRTHGRDVPMVHNIDRDHLRKFNLYGLSESHSAASHDPKLLRSLIFAR